MLLRKSELSKYAPFTATHRLLETLSALNAGTSGSEKSASVKATVFLSHSHKDKEIVGNAVRFLKSHGVDVYVDWLDDGMPSEVSGETAKSIKEKIKTRQKFVLLVTDNSQNSKWVPWELGIADGEKTIQNIASLAIANDDGTFQGSEYVQIYPKISRINGNWWVYLENSICIRLKDWFNKV